MTDDVVSFNEELEARVKKEFGDEATPEFINMLKLGKAAYEHGYNGFITKEKVKEWAGEMYKAGQQQKQIRSGKTHGKILINSSDIINAGSNLSIFGERDGFLTKHEEEYNNL